MDDEQRERDASIRRLDDEQRLREADTQQRITELQNTDLTTRRLDDEQRQRDASIRRLDDEQRLREADTQQRITELQNTDLTTRRLDDEQRQRDASIRRLDDEQRLREADTQQRITELQNTDLTTRRLDDEQRQRDASIRRLDDEQRQRDASIRRLDDEQRLREADTQQRITELQNTDLTTRRLDDEQRQRDASVRDVRRDADLAVERLVGDAQVRAADDARRLAEQADQQQRDGTAYAASLDEAQRERDAVVQRLESRYHVRELESQARVGDDLDRQQREQAAYVSSLDAAERDREALVQSIDTQARVRDLDAQARADEASDRQQRDQAAVAAVADEAVRTRDAVVQRLEARYHLEELDRRRVDDEVERVTAVSALDEAARQREAVVLRIDSQIRARELDTQAQLDLARDRQRQEGADSAARTLAEIEQGLRSQGVSGQDLRNLTGGKRASVAVARRVERLLGHFSPEDVRHLGGFLTQRARPLDDQMIDDLVDNVSRGQMAAIIRQVQIHEVHADAIRGAELAPEDLVEHRGATIHPGRPPRDREIVETPASRVLRAALIARDGEAPLPGYHAHHIIPDREFGEGLDWMRDRLEDAGASINAADNGVFLAAHRNTANPELTQLHNSYIHAGKQKEYAYTLTCRLHDKRGAAFLGEVRKIAREMADGKFRTKDIPHGFKTKWQPGMSAPVRRGLAPARMTE